MTYRNPKTYVRLLKNMKNFHRKIKYKIFPENCETLMDLGSGRLNDLLLWSKKKVKKVYAIEIDKKSISEGVKKYKNIKTRGRIKLPDVIFINTDLEKDTIINSFYNLKGKIDHIVCNFSFHYFLREIKTLNNIAKIIDFFLKPGGSLNITTFNGLKVWEKLLENSEYKIFEFVKSKKINYFQIKRLYEPMDCMLSYGEAINVYVISIGRWHREYLVNLYFLRDFFESYGLIFEKKIDFEEFLTEKDNLKRFELEYSKLNMYIKFVKNHTN